MQSFILSVLCAILAQYQPLIDYAGPECAGALVQACYTVEHEYGYRVDPRRLATLAKYESGFRADATGQAGERGYLQLHPIHKGAMGRLGLDFTSDRDRLVFATLLYAWHGDAPWSVRKKARRDYRLIFE